MLQTGQAANHQEAQFLREVRTPYLHELGYYFGWGEGQITMAIVPSARADRNSRSHSSMAWAECRSFAGKNHHWQTDKDIMVLDDLDELHHAVGLKAAWTTSLHRSQIFTDL